MLITFYPIYKTGRPVIARHGDTLILDGEPFDFTALPEGARLPAEAIASNWICGDVVRRDGVLGIPLLLSHGGNAPEETRFPEPVRIAEDGPVVLPPYTIAPKDQA